LKQKSHIEKELKENTKSKEELDELILTSAFDKEKKVKIFEYDLLNLLITLNSPLSHLEPILKLIQKYTSKGSFLKSSNINRHNGKDMLTDEIQPFLKYLIEEDLNKYRFSLIIDESSDLSKKKFLAIMVQYFHPNKGYSHLINLRIYYLGIQCKLHSFKECSIDASAEALYSILDEEILKKPFSKNLIGFMSDGAHVMKGCNNSVITRLQEKYPKLWSLYCVNHALHLVASQASEKLSNETETFVKKCFKFFKGAPQRVAQFDQVIEGMKA
jgi:hypothetical protein